MKATRLTVRQPGPPPFGLLAALALWGWQAELLPWAVAMGLILEGARWSPVRFEVGRADFNRLWNFTTLLFIGVALYLFLAREGFSTVGSLVTTESAGTRLEGLRRLSQTAVTFVRWLPMVLFPFAAVHAWSQSLELPWSTFSLYLRARESKRSRSADANSAGWQAGIHFGHVFLATTLFASCATVAHATAFLPLFMVVVAYGLWPFRNRRFPAPVWAALVLVLLGTTFAAQRGLMALRGFWQELENRWMQRAGGAEVDQLRGYTALGAVGRIKQSGAVVLRIRSPEDSPPPLLREAVYNRFRLNAWSSTHRDFGTVDPLMEGLWWRLTPQHRGGDSFQVARFTSGGSAALALPAAAHTIRELPALLVETNYLSAARLQFGPALAVYTVEHGQGGGFDGAPESDDTDLEHLAAPDRDVVREVAAAWGLLEGTPRRAVE